MTSDKLQEELGTLLGRCINVIRELEAENAELKARREWQSLTDEERKQFAQWVHPDVLERVEAALKEKNA